MKKITAIFLLFIITANVFANQNEESVDNITEEVIETNNELNIQTNIEVEVESLSTYVPFKLDLQKDTLILGSALTLFAADFILSSIDNNVVQINSKLTSDEVNKIDRIFMRPYSKKLDLLGTGFELATAVTPLFLITTPKTEWGTIVTMYAETMLFAYGFKEFAKAVFDRPRPYMYFDNFPIEEVQKGDWNSSFFSGHTTLSFAAATFTSYVFCKYNPDSKWKIPVIATSYTFAAATAAMRILSGNPFLTDVAIGAVVGSITGLLVPFLHYVNPSMPVGVIGNTEKAYLSVLPNSLSFTVRL
jgi:undecaprenyl-diphosphatase